MDENPPSPSLLGPPGRGPAKQMWLVTFTDLVSLMLAFFVLLFSMSTIKTDQWKTVTESLTRRLNPSAEAEPVAAANIGGLTQDVGLRLTYLATLLETQMEVDPILRGALIHRLGDRLAISLPSDLLFGPGEALLERKAQAALFELGGILTHIANDIVVFGHTDPRPVTGERFTSNWELSVARAVAVSNELRRAGYTRDIIAYGAAESRFEDVTDLLPMSRRLELGRRVDILVTAVRGMP